MRTRFTLLVVLLGFVMISSLCLWVSLEGNTARAQGDSANEPVLYDEDAYEWEYGGTGYVTIEVWYQDPNGDDADGVYIMLDDTDLIEMYNWTEGQDPLTGVLYEYHFYDTEVDAYTEFYFYAEDVTGNDTILLDEGATNFILGDYIGYPADSDPILYDEDVYTWEFGGSSYVTFEVYYKDPDGDSASYVSVVLNEDDVRFMENSEGGSPSTGMLYEVDVDSADVDESTVFGFYAEDVNGDYTVLIDDTGYFVLGDYIGTSNAPTLSIIRVGVEDNNVVFEVRYTDTDGDSGSVYLYIIGQQVKVMQTTDTNPLSGQVYRATVPKSDLRRSSEFYFYAEDTTGTSSYLPGLFDDNYVLGNYISEEDWTATEKKEEGGGILAGRWGDPEVIVGIIGLVAVGAGSAYGIYRRKQKKGRFSELLTQVDQIYRSFKMNPHRCEIELEKMRAVISEDLKHSTIDEDNYSIIKERIDEIISEIRKENLLSQVQNVPKDIELRIKDMLIDGKISREEYDRILPIITGSDMAATDKERMQAVIGSWVREDTEKTEYPPPPPPPP
ncbi:MAG: hypothetical protein JSW28_05670 [Thermoplasmata archaeon]|nr:MAG: hypothetical protein JSW28_05670 [Thermoplasmata archaeon]